MNTCIYTRANIIWLHTVQLTMTYLTNYSLYEYMYIYESEYYMVIHSSIYLDFADAKDWVHGLHSSFSNQIGPSL